MKSKFLNLFLLPLIAVIVGIAPLDTAKTAEKSTARLNSSSWHLACTKKRFGKKRRCKMEQKVFVKKTRKLLIGAGISKTGPKRDKPVMLLQLPTGLFLPAGIAIQIDKNKAHTAVVQTCDARGCFTGLPLTNAMIANMKKGNSVTIAFKNLKKQTIAVGLSLSGFTAAFKLI